MARRRSNPPRARKGRNGSEAPPRRDSDVAVVVVEPTDSVSVLTNLATDVTTAAPVDEMAALDVAWDELS
jgi:hypothetical protein